VDLVVSTIDTQAVSVSPNKTNVLLTFKVQNNGNTVQDFLLSSLAGSSAFSGADEVTDSYDLSNIRVFVDSNKNGKYDDGTDTQTYIDELAPDDDITVFIIADVPADAANDKIAVYDLQAQVAQGGTASTQGAAITDDNANQADDAATVQIVFADGAGSAGDIEHNGIFASSDAWKIVTADVTVSKNSIVVSDPVNGTTNPKRIPGAVVRYCYIVVNADGGADATGALVTDTLDPAILDTTGKNVATYSGAGTCDCNSADAEITGSNGANGQDPNAQGVLKVDFETVAGGATECAYVSATIK
jgi:hypothetical protein